MANFAERLAKLSVGCQTFICVHETETAWVHDNKNNRGGMGLH